MGAVAPQLPLAIPVGIGSVGWIAGIRTGFLRELSGCSCNTEGEGCAAWSRPQGRRRLVRRLSHSVPRLIAAGEDRFAGRLECRNFLQRVFRFAQRRRSILEVKVNNSEPEGARINQIVQEGYIFMKGSPSQVY
jgi:hypothetical protein